VTQEMRWLTAAGVVLAVAILGTVVLVAGCTKPQQAAPAAVAPTTTGTAATDTSAADTSATPASDTETATCPVSGQTMAKKDMIAYDYQGKTYYFCCSDCLPKFKADPDKYIGPGGHPDTDTSMGHSESE
jgi:YHS domain-containing protein